MNHKVHETKVDLKSYQMHKLNELLVFVSGFNEFYKEKFQGIQLPITSRHDLASLPFVTKIIGRRPKHVFTIWSQSFLSRS